MKTDNKQLVVAVTSGGFWGKGCDLETALSSCREHGAKGTQKAVVYLYSGKESDLKEVIVDDYGVIHYPSSITSFRVGTIKMNMNQ